MYLYFSSGLVVKNPPAYAGYTGDVDSIPGVGRYPEKEMVTHSSILAWEIPRTEEPGGLPSIGSQRVTQKLSMHMHGVGI